MKRFWAQLKYPYSRAVTEEEWQWLFQQWTNDWGAVADWLDWYYYPEKLKNEV